MSTSEKPTILLIHGAWHTPVHYRPFRDALETRGYTVQAPTLPSCVAYPGPVESPAEADIELVAAEARRLVEEGGGRDVVAIAHSYGGVVATDALVGLGARARAEQGLRGGVRRLIYTTAFVLQPGQRLDGDEVRELEWHRFEGDYKILKFKEVDIGHLMYTGLPRDAQAEILKTVVPGHPKACTLYRQRHAAYDEIDPVYVYAEGDIILPVAFQRVMVDGVRARGVPIHEASVDAGHFPSLSMPQRLADTVEAFFGHPEP